MHNLLCRHLNIYLHNLLLKKNHIHSLTFVLTLAVYFIFRKKNKHTKIDVQEFIIKAEEELFTDENLLKLEPEALISLYKEAIKNLKDVQATINNYKRSNRDLLSQTDLQTDVLKDMLMSLPQDKIEQLMDLLQGEE